jgi:hypothetical protein
MYYTGTQQECIEYNTKVTVAEKYIDSTVRWMRVVVHQNGINFAILKHENYESEMQTVDEIPDSWGNNSGI